MHLEIVIASVRPGRVGGDVGAWFATRAERHAGFDVGVSDLAEIALPLHDEPAHPRTGQYEHEHTRRWSQTVSRADAVAFVMPEYNFSFSASVKNAVDYLNREWAYLSVGFVSYGGVSGGMRAVAAFKQVVTTLRMVPVLDSVTVPMVCTMIDGDGFHPTEIVEQSADTMLDELVKLATALQPLRADALAAD